MKLMSCYSVVPPTVRIMTSALRISRETACLIIVLPSRYPVTESVAHHAASRDVGGVPTHGRPDVLGALRDQGIVVSASMYHLSAPPAPPSNMNATWSDGSDMHGCNVADHRRARVLSDLFQQGTSLIYCIPQVAPHHSISFCFS